MGKHNNGNLEENFLLSQYEKLRDEIVARNGYTLQIAQFTLAVFGVLAGIAFAVNNPNNKVAFSSNKVAFLEEAPSGQSDGIKEIILGYPALAFFSSILYLSNQTAIYKIGEYIRENLEKNVDFFTAARQSPDSSKQTNSQGNGKWWEQWIIKKGELKTYNLSRAVAAFLLFPVTQSLAILAYLLFLLPQPISLSPRQSLIVGLAIIITVVTGLSLLILDLVEPENWRNLDNWMFGQNKAK